MDQKAKEEEMERIGKVLGRYSREEEGSYYSNTFPTNFQTKLN